MKNSIYCTHPHSGVHNFYLVNEGECYYLFSQNYRRGVEEYFSEGVLLEKALRFSGTHGDKALLRTKEKLPSYIRYIEQNYGITVLRKTEKRLAKIQ